jgi:hypothetical protein
MKQKIKISERIVAICLLLLCILSLFAATSLRINLKSGSSTSFALSNLKTVCFTGGDMVVNSKDATTSSFALTNMSYLDFSDVPTVVAPLQSSAAFIIYPNPVGEVLNIDMPILNEQKVKLDIIGVDGRIVLSSQLYNGKSTISVSTLPKGLYLCRVQLGVRNESCKFIKR